MSRLPFQGPHVFQHAAAGSRLLQLNVATYMQPAWSNFAGSADFRLVAPSWTQRHSKVSSACLALNFSFGGSIGLSGHLGAGECFSCEAQGIFESHVRRKSGPHFLLALATYRCISFRFPPRGPGSHWNSCMLNSEQSQEPQTSRFPSICIACHPMRCWAHIHLAPSDALRPAHRGLVSEKRCFAIILILMLMLQCYWFRQG